MLFKKTIFPHLVCIVLSALLVYLLGYPLRVDRILLTYFSLIFFAHFTLGKFIFGFLFILAAIYFPTSYYYGSPNVAVISALLETNLDESSEYFSQLPPLLLVAPIFLILVFIFTFTKLQFPKINNKYFILFALAVCLYKPVKILCKSNANLPATFVIDNFKYPFFEFFTDLYTSIKIYTTEKQEQLEQIKYANTIPIISVSPKHKTYVIMIGESVRKDYMSAYGFKYDNTPFANHNASIIWDGLIAPAPNTQSSIPHFISQSVFIDDKKVTTQINNNIISIANAAGFETYWLSNQGRLGKMEITVPRIAAYSKHSFYTKKGEYNGKNSRGKHDTLLLPELDTILSTEQTRPRLIVMHLIGSHPHFCKRLEFDVQFNLNNKNISCYVSSIKETDDLIKATIESLQKHHEDYALVYFSDHGLAHTDNYQDLRHNASYQNSYQVPLIFFDSNHTQQHRINRTISGFQFVYLLSHWLGIELDVKHDYMQNELMDISEQNDIKIKDWQSNKLYQFDNLKKDPNPY